MMDKRTPSAAQIHPTREQWQLFVNQKIGDTAEIGRLARHLDSCAACHEVVSLLPSPPLYILGRPLFPVLPIGWEDMECATTSVTCLFSRALPTGGIVRIGADWMSQTLLNQILAVSLTRIRRAHGVSVLVENASGTDELPPSMPESEISVLLEAPAFLDCSDWLQQRTGRLVILTGLDEDWLALPGPVKPDISLSAQYRAGSVTSKLLPLVRRWTHAWKTADPRGRNLLLRLAGGADLTALQIGDLGADTVRLVHQVQDAEGIWQDWHAATGSWVLLHALQNIGKTERLTLPALRFGRRAHLLRTFRNP